VETIKNHASFDTENRKYSEASIFLFL